MKKIVIDIDNVTKAYGDHTVLSNINLQIYDGEYVAVLGFSGSGKTTLVNLISRLLKPDSGAILFNGNPVAGPSHERGVIFQNYSLLPWYTVYQNIKLSVDKVYPKWSSAERDAHIRKYIEMVNLTPATNKRPAELSGGMKQRTAVARTLATHPEVLLMDEPLSALDALTRGNLQEEILSIWTNNQCTALMVTNDVDEGIFMVDRILTLEPGSNGTIMAPESSINLKRPRDKKKMNADPAFKKVRTEIMNYMVYLEELQGQTQSKTTYHLPDVKPVMPRKNRGKLFRKAG